MQSVPATKTSRVRKEIPSLVSCFPTGRTPRPAQEEALQQIEALWDKADVFVVQLPVAVGKSLISFTIARWAQKKKLKSTLLTPTNILLEQYEKEFPGLCVMKRADMYRCHADRTGERTCGDMKRDNGRQCGKDCSLLQAVRKAYVYPYLATNYHMYIARKLYNDVLLVDEAHNLLPLLAEMNSKKYWVDDWGIPPWATTYGSLVRWLESDPRLDESEKLQFLYKQLTDGKQSYLIQRTEEDYRGAPRACLKLVPVDLRDMPPVMWPTGKVRKIILLSATIGAQDIKELGLDKRRVAIISAPSPIPAENRPVILGPYTSLAYAQQLVSIPKVAARLTELLSRHVGEKGIVHAPYGVARQLRHHLNDPRFLFHDSEDKAEVYRKFRELSPESGAVLVASGMYEGIDLAEDAARWQVIAKVPWPSLAEPAIKYKAEASPEWYAWEAAKQMIQGVGRVCRSTTDYGVTYIWDSSFDTLYTNWPDFFPPWWKEAVHTYEELVYE